MKIIGIKACRSCIGLFVDFPSLMRLYRQLWQDSITFDHILIASAFFVCGKIIAKEWGCFWTSLTFKNHVKCKSTYSIKLNLVWFDSCNILKCLCFWKHVISYFSSGCSCCVLASSLVIFTITDFINDLKVTFYEMKRLKQ